MGEHRPPDRGGPTDPAASIASALPTEAPSSPPSEQNPPAVDVSDQLRKSNGLHAEGLITDEEFATKKADLLDRL